jgi:hypothetical protein
MLTESSVVVLMTHNYLQDGALLERLLSGPARYIGCLGRGAAPSGSCRKYRSNAERSRQSTSAGCMGRLVSTSVRKRHARSHSRSPPKFFRCSGIDSEASFVNARVLSIPVRSDTVTRTSHRSAVFLRLRWSAKRPYAIPPGTTAIVILAAGGAQRMARPKQLLRFHGQTLLRRAVETALADQPLVTADDINTLVEVYRRTGKSIVASEYAGTSGAPMVLSKRLFAEVAALNGDEGAKRLRPRHHDEVATVPVPGAAFDIDTPHGYERLSYQGATLSRYGGQGGARSCFRRAKVGREGWDSNTAGAR